MCSSVVLEESSAAILAGSLDTTSTEDLYHNDGCNRSKNKVMLNTKSQTIPEKEGN
jgi:hypothetical protein